MPHPNGKSDNLPTPGKPTTHAPTKRGLLQRPDRTVAFVPVRHEIGFWHPRLMLPDRQLDLFDASGHAAPGPPTLADRPLLITEALNDDDLVAAIPGASLEDCCAVTREAVRRRLGVAVPALEALCRRFRGFGLEHTVPEQVAALQALAGLGGPEAAAAVTRIIAGDIVQGPGVIEVMRAAVVLRCRLPADKCFRLLRHPDPTVRAHAAHLASPRAGIIDPITAVLVDLLQDLNGAVARAAAFALGRVGRGEARPMLLRMLREDPSADVIDAAVAVADEQIIVLLGRIARTRPELAPVASAALDDIDDPRAAALASALRGAQSDCRVAEN